jgi:hypothetical protein
LVHGVALTHKRCFFSVLTLGVPKRPCFFLLKPPSTQHPCATYGIPLLMNALFGQSLLCDLLSRTSTLDRSPLLSSSPRPHLLRAYVRTQPQPQQQTLGFPPKNARAPDPVHAASHDTQLCCSQLHSQPLTYARPTRHGRIPLRTSRCRDVGARPPHLR